MSVAKMSDMDIPIDIHISKLLNWLISRRHVKSNWSQSVALIREKINEALKDMPNDSEMASLISGSYINYFHCKELVEILKTTEAGSKTVFGTYKSKRMNDWLDIIKTYERDNLFIAECARLYYSNVHYEVPSLKKQMQKLQQSQYDFEKREADLTKNHLSLCTDLKNECNVLGIKGESIRDELQAIVPGLAKIYGNVVDCVSKLIPAIELYKQYKAEQSINELGLPVLLHVLGRGNTTVYEYLYQSTPEKIILGKLAYEIDGENDEYSDGNADLFTVCDLSDDSIQIEEVACGKEALCILDDPVYRDLFINDVTELQTFLKVRLSENADGKGGGNPALMQNIAYAESEEEISKMLSDASTIIEMIDGNSARKLHNIKHIPRHLDQLAEELNSKEDAIRKTQDKIDQCILDGKQVYEEQQKIKNDLNSIMDKNKLLKVQIEGAISQLYNKRTVNLI